MKPTRGRVTMAPWTGETWAGFVQEHVLTRSVRDSALLLDISDPPTPGEPYAAPHKERPFLDEVGADPKALRVAVHRGSLWADGTHADCLEAVDRTASLLEELGHEVTEARPTFDRDELVRAYFLVVGSGVARFVETTAAAAGRRPRASDYEPATWVLAQIAWKASAPDLMGAEQTIQVASREIAAFFEQYDTFVCPTMARPPARIGELAVQPAERFQLAVLRTLPFKRLLDVALDKMGSGRLVWMPNTQLFNQTGQPAMSVPLHWNAVGLPIGVQFAGRFGDEATLFRLAAQLETARPWADRKPTLLL